MRNLELFCGYSAQKFKIFCKILKVKCENSVKKIKAYTKNPISIPLKIKP